MTVSPSKTPPLMPPPVPVQGLHHFAWRCRDAEETRHFYEDVLGLPLVHVIRADRVPSTGEWCPYVHLFFALRDGSCVAFFDLGDGVAATPSPNTPPWVNHLALRIDTRTELQQVHRRLAAHGIEVVGPTDHHFVESIYFFDPNGLRVELTTPAGNPDYLVQAAREARPACDAWTREKRHRSGWAAAGRRDGR